MFCPNCGKAEQKAETYCRQCGVFLPNLEKKTKFGEKPEEQLFISQFLNVITGLTGFGIGIALLYNIWGVENTPIVFYIAMAFSFVIGFWQISIFFINWSLSQHLNRKNLVGDENESDSQTSFQSLETNELLPEADFSNVTPGSITENTTSDLKEKVKRSTKSQK